MRGIVKAYRSQTDSAGTLQKASFIQPKLTVNKPGDQHEQEADRIAEQVVQSKPADAFFTSQPASITPVQRKCAACEEEEKKGVQRKCDHCEKEEKKAQRKETNNASVNDAPSLDSYVGGLSGKGQALDPQVRSYYEPRIGYNFSNVRVHTDQVAAKSAQSINALAYTTGNNIVFNNGQYAPQTDSGKKLLAHELTHVVQQSGNTSTVQRLSPGDASFLISDIPSDAGDRDNFVFFERNDAVIPATEDHKIADFVTTNPGAPVINLYGYASEEGNEGENDTLVTQRLDAVRAIMQPLVTPSSSSTSSSAPGTAINIIPRRRAGDHQILYRDFRSVEMATGPSSLGGSAASINTRNCTASEHSDIDTAKTDSLTQVDEAIRLVRAFQATPASNTDVQTTIHNNFHSHSSSTVTTLLHHLRQLRTDLNNLTGDRKRQCASDQYNNCSGADALTARPTVTFCPHFFSGDTPAQQVETLLHEMCHYALFHARDRAYREERVLNFLSPAEALNNAESIAIFINEVNNPGTRVTSALTTPSADTVTGCGSNQTQVEEALAWAQRWNQYAFFGVSQTYSDWDHFLFMAPYITARLGPINRFTVAGIFDRYTSLMHLFDDTFTFRCLPAGPTCTAPVHMDTASEEIEVCPSFFTHNARRRIVMVFAEVTRLVPEIRDDQREAYAELARDYKIHFWGLPPT
ncbi:MAG: DUF4157 domain-containing protein [Chitinophagaceae bacterium]